MWLNYKKRYLKNGKVLYLSFVKKKKKKPYTIQIVFIFIFIFLFYALIVGIEEFWIMDVFIKNIKRDQSIKNIKRDQSIEL